MKYNTIKEATQAWVSEFNAIPLSLIEKAYCNDRWELYEVTPIKHRCEECDNEHYESFAEDNDYKCECGGELEQVEEYSCLPMWGTMWTFGDSADDCWIENHLEEMADCGFRVYESDELGYYFGIDGAGYSFYDEYWIPLYKIRGLQWHRKEEVV